MKRTTLGRAVERLRVCTKGAATPDRRNERRSIGIEIHGNAAGATDSGGMRRGLGCRSKSVPVGTRQAGVPAPRYITRRLGVAGIPGSRTVEGYPRKARARA